MAGRSISRGTIYLAIAIIAGLSAPPSATAQSAARERFAPVPANARGYPIGSEGFAVQSITTNLYLVTDGVYQMMFLVTPAGVVAFDAPPSIGRNILKAIRSVTDQPITHVVYSHVDADHIGAAGLYPTTATYTAHRETARLLARQGRSTTQIGEPPAPKVIFDRSHTFEVGGERIELNYRGANHVAGNIFIWLPRQKTLMAVDLVQIGWAPFYLLNVSRDVPAWLGAHDHILSYPFEHFVGGHVNRLGTRKDVEDGRAFAVDMRAAALAAADATNIGEIVREIGRDNPYAIFRVYLDRIGRKCAADLTSRWGARLGGVDVFSYDNCRHMAESLRLDRHAIEQR